MEDSFQIEGIDARLTVTRHKVAKVFWFFFQKRTSCLSLRGDGSKLIGIMPWLLASVEYASLLPWYA